MTCLITLFLAVGWVAFWFGYATGSDHTDHYWRQQKDAVLAALEARHD